MIIMTEVDNTSAAFAQLPEERVSTQRELSSVQGRLRNLTGATCVAENPLSKAACFFLGIYLFSAIQTNRGFALQFTFATANAHPLGQTSRYIRRPRLLTDSANSPILWFQFRLFSIKINQLVCLFVFDRSFPMLTISAEPGSLYQPSSQAPISVYNASSTPMAARSSLNSLKEIGVTLSTMPSRPSLNLAIARIWKIFLSLNRAGTPFSTS